MAKKFVSRAGEKLQFALDNFNISVEGLISADFGSSTGGFVDCLLQNSVSKVYSIDTSYGELSWKLRNDKRVVVMERTNALHVSLPEKVDFISIDVSWTKQKLILPIALSLLKDKGIIVSLLKPHYEAEKYMIYKGRLKEEFVKNVVDHVLADLKALGIKISAVIESPIEGKKGYNKELLLLIQR